MFSSGLTTLNLAITGDPTKFADSGNIVSYIGASDAGKTILGLTTQADSFYNYGVRPIFYPVEPNLQIDIDRLYGRKFARALEIVDSLGMSLEQWQADVRGRLDRAKKPVCVVLDSTDALKCVADINAMNGTKKQPAKAATETPEGEGAPDDPFKKGIKAKMGGEAASAWSQCLSQVSKSVSGNKGLLVLLSQIRTKPGVVFGSPHYRSCGMALDFFSEVRIWMYPSSSEKIGDVKVGGWTKIEVKRNKVTGETRTIYAPIYPSYGVDNVRSMLHFLADTDSGASWAGKGLSTIRVGDQTMSLGEMAAFFDTPETHKILTEKVVTAWQAREKQLVEDVLCGRVARYGK